jgi:hypothetical protein
MTPEAEFIVTNQIQILSWNMFSLKLEAEEEQMIMNQENSELKKELYRNFPDLLK